MKKKFLKAQETKSLELKDAITMTKGDEVVYEKLRRSSDEKIYPGLVVTPYMSKAAGYVSTGEIEGKLHIGDFINYTAGEWTLSEINSIGANNSLNTSITESNQAMGQKDIVKIHGDYEDNALKISVSILIKQQNSVYRLLDKRSFVIKYR